MEVRGGRYVTRSSATGSKGCCRGRSNWCMGRAARYACCRWGGSTMWSRSPMRREVIFTTCSASASPRARLSCKSPDASGESRRVCDIRIVYLRRWTALALAQRQPGARGGVLRARFRDDVDAVDRADRFCRPCAKAIGSTFRCSATTSRSCRRSRRSSTAPDLRIDGFLGPGHVSMVEVGKFPRAPMSLLRGITAGRWWFPDSNCRWIYCSRSFGSVLRQLLPRRPRRGREPVCAHRPGGGERGGAGGGRDGL